MEVMKIKPAYFFTTTIVIISILFGNNFVNAEYKPCKRGSACSGFGNSFSVKGPAFNVNVGGKKNGSFVTVGNKGVNGAENKNPRVKTLKSNGTSCKAISATLRRAKTKGIHLPIMLERTFNGYQYVLDKGAAARNGAGVGIKISANGVGVKVDANKKFITKSNFIKNDRDSKVSKKPKPKVKIKKVKTQNGEKLAVEATLWGGKICVRAPCPGNSKSKALCDINVCPVVVVGGRGGGVKVHCKNPLKHGGVLKPNPSTTMTPPPGHRPNPKPNTHKPQPQPRPTTTKTKTTTKIKSTTRW